MKDWPATSRFYIAWLDHRLQFTVVADVLLLICDYIQGHAGIVHQQYESRGVLLLRNPMDVVFTFRHWQSHGKVDHAPPEAFKGPKWEEAVDYVAYAWADHAIRWIEQIKNGTVIFYEKLLGDAAEEELERLLNVLSFHPIDPDRMRCALAHRNRTDYKRQNKTRYRHYNTIHLKSTHICKQDDFGTGASPQNDEINSSGTANSSAERLAEVAHIFVRFTQSYWEIVIN